MYTATSRLSFESEITTGLLKKERSLLNSAVILYHQGHLGTSIRQSRLVERREPKRTHLLSTCIGPSTRHSTFVESEPTPLHCDRTVERPPAFRAYRFILRTRFSLTTPRGLVRQNWTKKRECSTGTTVNKNRNYIDNCFSPYPSLRL